MKLLRSLKNNYKKTAILILLAVAITSLQRNDPPVAAKQLATYYLAKLKQFQQKLKDLDKNIQQKASRKNLQSALLQCRISYKRFSLLTDYFNRYESKQVNGPDVSYAEDDNRKTMLPHGLQVLEGKIFSSQPIGFKQLDDEVSGIMSITDRWLKEPGPDKKFTGPLVFDAMQFAMIRLMTMDISGFDSPIAQNSLPEARSTIESMQAMLQIFQPEINKTASVDFEKLDLLFNQSTAYLNQHNQFNSFDRLTFISNFISPAYSLFVKIRLTAGFSIPSERNPFHADARSIFDSSFFNIDFFSPNERFRTTPERIALGNKLFYDPVLSGSGKRSCASCHKPELAFTDGLATSLAMDEKKHLLRNTPTLWNAALQTKQFYDSRTSTLENQLSDVVHNADEMKGALKESVTAFQQDNVYRELFAKAYPGDPEKISQYNIANAISSYMRSLISLNSKFDQYMRGKTTALNTSEKHGFNIFMGKAKCGTCHFMPLFNGLVPPAFTETESEVLGVPSTKDTLHATLDTDKGKMNFTKAVIHQYAFRIPTLRNVALTAPYMHNGVFTTLEEVMDFYNRGGGSGLKIAPENQTLPADKLNLTKKEMSDMIAFLKTLTDTSGRR
ncbi:MAG: cytochrome c peroxidase [Ferruginibacter sp.]